jgi:hypothetical protein
MVTHSRETNKSSTPKRPEYHPRVGPVIEGAIIEENTE